MIIDQYNVYIYIYINRIDSAFLILGLEWSGNLRQLPRKFSMCCDHMWRRTWMISWALMILGLLEFSMAMVLDVSSRYFHMHSWVSIKLAFNATSEEHPIVFWDEERDRQRVYESDLTNNYHLLRNYLVKFGHNTPLPDLRHHQAISSQFAKTVQHQCAW